MSELNQVIGMVPNLIRALPVLIAYLVIAKLAYSHIKSWKSPTAPTEAAYTMIALAAFAYVVRL